MPRYKYTGDTEEVFPNLPGASAVLRPGDEIDVDEELHHPRLELVEPAVADPPAEPAAPAGGEQ